MSCYTCSRKNPYRVEVIIKGSKKEITGETASINRKKLDEQIEILITKLLSECKYKKPQIEVRVYHNNELLTVENRAA